jgi:hypothetical protein
MSAKVLEHELKVCKQRIVEAIKFIKHYIIQSFAQCTENHTIELMSVLSLS